MTTKKTRGQIVEEFRSRFEGKVYSWEMLADAAIEATGYECAPEKPERQAWWGRRLSLKGGWVYDQDQEIFVADASSVDIVNRATLVASHNCRVGLVEGLRRLIELQEDLFKPHTGQQLVGELSRLLDEAE